MILAMLCICVKYTKTVKNLEYFICEELKHNKVSSIKNAHNFEIII